MAEWRKVENTVSDGPGQDRTETSYVFGAEYDGVFVPALTKSAGYFEHLLERGKQDAENAQDAQTGDEGTTTATGTSTTQTGA
jgi:hypothetical protein